VEKDGAAVGTGVWVSLQRVMPCPKKMGIFNAECTEDAESRERPETEVIEEPRGLGYIL